MLDKAQTAKVMEVLKLAVKDGPKDQQKRVPIQTSLPDADWVLVDVTDKGQHYLQFENKAKDKTDKYRFSINASKKLIGAIQHSPPVNRFNFSPAFPIRPPAILSDAYRRLDHCGADKELIELAKTCLDPDPERGPSDAGEIAESISIYEQNVQNKLHEAEISRAESEITAAEDEKRYLVKTQKRKAERQRNRLLLSLAATRLLFTIGGSLPSVPNCLACLMTQMECRV